MHDLARGGGLLQAGGGVDRVAGDQASGRSAGSPATTSPVLTPVRKRMAMPRSASSSTFRCHQALADLGGRPHRAQRVILVQLRDAEDRHHRVADELLDRPAVALDDGAASRRSSGPSAPRIDSGSSCSPRLVEPDTSANRMVTVRRDSAAGLRRERCSALGAELRAVGVLGAAGGTHHGHAVSVRPARLGSPVQQSAAHSRSW